MSRIVAAACCVYFLLPFLLFQTARLCYLQASGLLTCPLWHVPSLKCSFDGTFVKHDNEGSPTPGQAEIRLHTDCTVQACQCLYTFVVFCMCICRFIAVYLHVFPSLNYCLSCRFKGFVQKIWITNKSDPQLQNHKTFLKSCFYHIDLTALN